VWSEARRPIAEDPVALQTYGVVREILESLNLLLKLKAVWLSNFAGGDDGLTKSVTI